MPAKQKRGRQGLGAASTVSLPPKSLLVESQWRVQPPCSQSTGRLPCWAQRRSVWPSNRLTVHVARQPSVWPLIRVGSAADLVRGTRHRVRPSLVVMARVYWSGAARLLLLLPPPQC